MNETHDVISAFLDDEPFDASSLVAALSDPAGRELLIDLVALRHLTQPTAKDTPLVDRRPRLAAARTLFAAAAVLTALVGGYVAGDRRHEPSITTTPPPATRVVQASTPWQDVIPGRTR